LKRTTGLVWPASGRTVAWQVEALPREEAGDQWGVRRLIELSLGGVRREIVVAARARTGNPVSATPAGSSASDEGTVSHSFLLKVWFECCGSVIDASRSGRRSGVLARRSVSFVLGPTLSVPV